MSTAPELALALAPRVAALIPMTNASLPSAPFIPSQIFDTPATFFAQGYNNNGTDALDAIVSRGIPPVLFWPFGCLVDPGDWFPCGRYAPGWTNSYKNRSGPDVGGTNAFCQVYSQGDLERFYAGGAAYVNRLVTAMSTRYASTDNVLGKRFIYAGVPHLDGPTDTDFINREIDACLRLNAVRVCDLEGAISPYRADGSPSPHFLARQREWGLGLSIGSEVGHRELPETMVWRHNSAAVMQLVSFWDQAHLSFPENWLTVRELIEAGIRPMAIILGGGTHADRRTDALRMAALGITPVVDLGGSTIPEQIELRDAVLAAGNVWANAAAIAWANQSTQGTAVRHRVRLEDAIRRPDPSKRAPTATHRMPVWISGARKNKIVDLWADNPDGDTKAIHVDSARPDNSGNGFSIATAKKTIAGAGGGLSALSGTRYRLRLHSVDETVSSRLTWPASADGPSPLDSAAIIHHGTCAIRTSTRLSGGSLIDQAVLSFFNVDYRAFAVYGDGTLTISQPGEWTVDGQGGVGIAVSQVVMDNFAAQGVVFDGIKDPVVFNPRVDGSTQIRSGNIAYRRCANLRPVSRNVSPINENTAGGISQFGADSVTVEECVFGPTATIANTGTRTNHALCYANNYAASFIANNIVHAGGIDGFTARQGGRVGYNLVLNSSMGISSGSVPSEFSDTLPNTDISRNLISGSNYRAAAFDGEAADEPGLPPLGRAIVVAKATSVMVEQNIILNANPSTVRDAHAVVVNLLKGRLDVSGNQVDRWARASNPSGDYPTLVFEENTVDAAARQIILAGNKVSTTLEWSILRTLRPDFPSLVASGNVYQTPAMVTNVAVAGVGTRIEWTSSQWATNTGEVIVLVAANPMALVSDWALANGIAANDAAVYGAALSAMASGSPTFEAIDVIDWVAGQRGMWSIPQGPDAPEPPGDISVAIRIQINRGESGASLSSPTSRWSTACSGGLGSTDSSVPTDSDNRMYFSREQLAGTGLSAVLQYPALVSSGPATQLVVRLLGRAGSSDPWAAIVNDAGQSNVEITAAPSTDLTVGVVKMGTHDYRKSWRVAGFEEFVFQVITALDMGGSTSSAKVLVKFT